MVNIDVIMEMLDWNRPAEVQKEGRELAKTVRSINVFLQPGHPGYGKNVWDNCAAILSERSDQELQPYLCELFRWLQDLNWPGAEIIFSRLKAYRRDDAFAYALKESLLEADALKEEQWLYNLREF